MEMDHSRGRVFTNKWAVSLVLDLVNYDSHGQVLNQRLLEPSCGEGAFLTVVAERLIEAQAMHGGTWEDLLPCVYACDIDSQSVQKAKENVRDVLLTHSCPTEIAESITEHWIHTCDFLLDSIPGDFDYVVGNPPYIRSTDIPVSQREEYCAVCPSMTAGTDVYVGFYDRGLDLLAEEGALAYLCADRWIQNKYGQRLRQRVNREFNLTTHVRLHESPVFQQDVSAYPGITVIRKSKVRDDHFTFVLCGTSFNATSASRLMTRIQYTKEGTSQDSVPGCMIAVLQKTNGDERLPLGDVESISLVGRARSKWPTIEESGVSVGIGIATGCDNVFITGHPENLEQDRVLPLFVMKDYRRGTKEQKWLVNPWDSSGSLVNLEQYPKLQSYLTMHRDRLEKRYVAKRNPRDWYRTLDRVNPKLIGSSLLLIPDMAATLDPVLVSAKYPHHNCYWLQSDIWNLSVLGGFLISDLALAFIDVLGVKMRGNTRRFQAQYLRMLHVPNYSTLSAEIKRGLSDAFNAYDRDAASSYVREILENDHDR